MNGQVEAKIGQLMPLTGNLGQKMTVWMKMAEFGLKMAKLGQKMTKLGPNMAKLGPKMAKLEPKRRSLGKKWLIWG